MLPRGIRNHNPLNVRRSKDQWKGMAEVQTDPRAGCMPVLNFFGRYRSALTGLITTSLSKATGFTRYSSST